MVFIYAIVTENVAGKASFWFLVPGFWFSGSYCLRRGTEYVRICGKNTADSVHFTVENHYLITPTNIMTNEKPETRNEKLITGPGILSDTFSPFALLIAEVV
jgi:hypothetical protein